MLSFTFIDVINLFVKRRLLNFLFKTGVVKSLATLHLIFYSFPTKRTYKLKKLNFP